MELVNATRMAAGYTMGLEPGGRELLVVVVKGTFILPRAGESVRLHDEQVPLVMAATFTGEPGFSAPIHDADFAARKPACDILLSGLAHAPGGRPVSRMSVALQVGAMRKQIDVVGDRVWDVGLAGIRPTPPQRFVTLPVSYDLAFGGVDRSSKLESEHDAYLPNPVGRGFHRHLNQASVDGAALPNLETPGEAVVSPRASYRPAAFGPLGLGWTARHRFAGTYDRRWREEDFPFLPRDFDDRFNQSAPADQQLPHIRAPLDVVLENLTRDGLRRFSLPYFEAPVHVTPRQGAREQLAASLDTIEFDPDHERFTMTWRLTWPLRRSLHEIAQVRIGSGARKAWGEQAEASSFFEPAFDRIPSAVTS